MTRRAVAMSVGGRVNEQWMHDAEVRMEVRVESFGAGMEAGVAAERERIKREAEAAACQCLDHALCAGCHEAGENLGDLSFAAVLRIIEEETP